MVTITEDILEEYNIKTDFEINITKNIELWNNIEKIIYDILVLESFDTDDLVKKSDLTLNDISTNLSMLEIKWIIKKNINWKYEIR
jgi:predicted Rossmann fold nucleotide-binding protein DprA/Smf involved in DNA uptake